MIRTLSREIDQVVGIGKEAIGNGWRTPEEAQERAGLLIFQAQTGVGHDVEPIVGRGQMTLAVRMGQIGAEKMKEIRPNDPNYLGTRARLAQVLGEALLG